MRLQKRNCRSIKYCNFVDEVEIIDDEGYRTGEYRKTYTEPVTVERANVGIATGVFGFMEKYEKVVLIEGIHHNIDEKTIFFIDKDYELNADGIPLNDYEVFFAGETLNHTVIALNKVEKS